MASPAAGRPLTVGAVVRALAEEFPDVTVSKVRFLESEGLVTPARTPAGYRQYAAADVERLRYVLRSQRDRYLPLKVIRDHLAAIDRGLVPDGDAPPRPPRPPEGAPGPDAAALLARSSLRLSAAELADAAGLDPSAVAALTTHGLLRPDDDGYHGDADLEVARAAAGLAAYGLEARHLRVLRTAAERQVGLVEAAVGPRRGTAAERSRAEVAGLCLALHAALVRGALSNTSR